MKLALSYHSPPLPQYKHWEKYVCSRFRFKAVNLGAWMREIIASEADLGQRLKACLDKGQALPTDLLEEFLWHGIEAVETEKLMLLGFPRDSRQAEGLNRILTHFGFSELRFICLETGDPDLAVQEYVQNNQLTSEGEFPPDSQFEERIFESIQRYEDRLSGLLRFCPAHCLLRIDPQAPEEENREQLEAWLGDWILSTELPDV